MPDPQSIAAEDDALELCLGRDSPLARHLPGFAPRPGQLQMARAVARCLRSGRPLMVEAGTGTGKTLAYLVPAVLSGLKVVVSTGTRTLQDQINDKELPLLRRSLAPHLRWAVLKGRTNYLCRRRYTEFARQPALDLPDVRQGLARLALWLEHTDDGDLDRVRGRGLGPELLAEVTSDAEQCLGGRCPRREECFLMEARRRAAEAELVVVNHHLFLADLVLKAGGHGAALPRYQAVVFDEAHLLPEVATRIFGVSVSQGRLKTLLRDLGRLKPPDPRRTRAMAACEQAGRRLFQTLRGLARSPGGSGASTALTPAMLEELIPLGRALTQALEEVAAGLEGRDELAESLAQRCYNLGHDLQAVARPVPGQTIAWVSLRGRSPALNLSPVEIGPHLAATLYAEHSRLVFTSATLAAAGDLDPMRRRLGLEPDARGLIVPSPFDPANQALLYVPQHMPPPASPDWPQAVAREVKRLLELSRGRAFVLFTTHRNLTAVSRLLRDELSWPLLVQGQAPRLELLQRFVDQSPAVLMATASFWQGVDVPGPALSAVIVDKLPFAPPDDPLVAARCQLAQDQGRSGFAHVMLPDAVLSLKQGLGRLLRTPHDRGLLAVLDTRIVEKSYGRLFLRALEPVPLTRRRQDVRRFFDQ